MKDRKSVVAGMLLVMSLGTSGIHAAESTQIDTLDVLSVAPCKASGDGTYVEMITTMASVLPPAEAEAFLARYCEACNKQKLLVSQAR
jgi:hypothetical protein